MQAVKKAEEDLEKAAGDAPSTDTKAPPPPASRAKAESDAIKERSPPSALAWALFEC
jgi:hypothetical protein